MHLSFIRMGHQHLDSLKDSLSCKHYIKLYKKKDGNVG